MAKGAAAVKANCRSQRVAGSQAPVSPAHSSLGLPSRTSPRYQHRMFVAWVHRTAEGYGVPLACQPVNTRHLKALHYAIRQQERPDVQPSCHTLRITHFESSPDSSLFNWIITPRMLVMEMVHPLTHSYWRHGHSMQNYTSLLVMEMVSCKMPFSVTPSQRAQGHTCQRRPLGTPAPGASGLLFALPQRSLCTELLSDPLVELKPGLGEGHLHRARGPGAARRCRPARSPRASAPSSSTSRAATAVSCPRPARTCSSTASSRTARRACDRCTCAGRSGTTPAAASCCIGGRSGARRGRGRAGAQQRTFRVASSRRIYRASRQREVTTFGSVEVIGKRLKEIDGRADTVRQQECPQCIRLCWLEKSEFAQSAFSRCFSLGSGAFSFSYTMYTMYTMYTYIIICYIYIYIYMCVCVCVCVLACTSAHPSFSGYTSLHSLHRSTSARSALKHTISIDFQHLQSSRKNKQIREPSLGPPEFFRAYIPT